MFCSRLALSLPQVVTFGNNATITYFYAADGTKVRTVHVVNGATTQTDYCGNVIYENGVQKLLLTEEGYVDLSNPNTYYYYLKDHQGNNRVVIDGSGAVKETNHYYPFGGLFANSTIQPFKYNGKEFDGKNGLNWYDYGARHYDAALGRWHVVDPLADKYYGYSPYVYCANSPLLFVDPDGMDLLIWYRNDKGEQTYFRFNGSNADQAPKNDFVNNVITAYNYNINNGGGENLKEIATKSSFSIGIVETNRGNLYSPFDGKSSFIRFNPSAGLQLDGDNALSPATGLEHEAAHAKNDKTIGLDNREDSQYGKKEERKVIKGAETKTAKLNGELSKNHGGRKSHGDGKWIVTQSVTSNKEANKQKSEALRKRIESYR